MKVANAHLATAAAGLVACALAVLLRPGVRPSAAVLAFCLGLAVAATAIAYAARFPASFLAFAGFLAAAAASGPAFNAVAPARSAVQLLAIALALCAFVSLVWMAMRPRGYPARWLGAALVPAVVAGAWLGAVDTGARAFVADALLALALAVACGALLTCGRRTAAAS